jgi:hypothetical protein
MQGVGESLDISNGWCRSVLLPVGCNSGGKLFEGGRRCLFPRLVQCGDQFRKRNPVLISEANGLDVPRALIGIAFELKRQVHRCFRDRAIAALGHHATYRYVFRNEGRAAQIGDLLSDDVVGKS